jgi:hypothetical protein
MMNAFIFPVEIIDADLVVRLASVIVRKSIARVAALRLCHAVEAC